jgi:hypothetical protein
MRYIARLNPVIPVESIASLSQQVVGQSGDNNGTQDEPVIFEKNVGQNGTGR